MALQTPNIFYINDIIYKINEYIKDDNNLLNCNKYLNELKLKNYKLNIEYSLKYCNKRKIKNLLYEDEILYNKGRYFIFFGMLRTSFKNFMYSKRQDWCRSVLVTNLSSTFSITSTCIIPFSRQVVAALIADLIASKLSLLCSSLSNLARIPLLTKSCTCF